MPDYVPLTIADIRQETADAISVSFAIPAEHREAFRYRPGQYLALLTTLGGTEVRRTYSICSGPDDRHLAIAIKRVPGGVFSNWACDALRPGMSLEAMPPAGRFVLPEVAGDKRHILAIAAGAGITPIIAMAEHAMRRHPDLRFTLIYGNRDTASIIFRQRLEDLKDAHLDRLSLVHVLSRNEESDTPLLEGRITADKVRAFGRLLFRAEDVDDVFLCGPGSLIRDVRNTLFELGFARERVHHEFFAPGGGAFRAAPPVSARETVQPRAIDAPADRAPSDTEVIAVLDGARHRIVAHAGETIIDAALRAGLRAPYSCRGGMCSTCRARIVEGAAVMRVNYSLEPWEVEKGFVLTCQAVAQTLTVTVDFDQM